MSVPPCSVALISAGPQAILLELRHPAVQGDTIMKPKTLIVSLCKLMDSLVLMLLMY